MKTIFSVLLVPLAASAISICASDIATAGELNIAVAGPMSGQYRQFGRQMRVGARQAVADINAAGGVKVGAKVYQLKLTVSDDACDQNRAIKLAGEYAIRKILFVAGHFCSGSSIPASHIYATEGIIQISPGSRHPAFTDERAGPNIYRLSGRDDQQGQLAGRYLVKNFRVHRIAILHGKTAYGKKLASDVEMVLRQAGVKPVYTGAYSAGTKGYGRLIRRLQRRKVEILYIGGHHVEAGLILRQMRDKGMDTILVSGDALITKDFWDITGSAGEGTVVTFLPDPRLEPKAADLTKQLKAQNIDAAATIFYTYAAVQAWVQAVQLAGTTDQSKVSQALDSMMLRTVLGSFTFDAKGDASLPSYSYYRWSKGELKRL